MCVGRNKRDFVFEIIFGFVWKCTLSGKKKNKGNGNQNNMPYIYIKMKTCLISTKIEIKLE